MTPDEERRKQHEEDLARLKAESDQAIEAMRELARNFKAFHDELVEQGFGTKEAMEAGTAWLIAMFSSRKDDSDD